MNGLLSQNLQVSVVSESSRFDSHFRGVLDKPTQPSACFFPVVYRRTKENIPGEANPPKRAAALTCRDSVAKSA